ncbi:MAG: hypothetical protein NT013_02210 [Planctomycetia bacterium]|nr:hypothetical protein [Planctomycetia bacterium]
MSESRDPDQRSWSEWWRLMNSTPWHDAIRGRLTGALAARRSFRQWLQDEFQQSQKQVDAIVAESGLPEPIQAAVLRIVSVARVGKKKRREYAEELVRGFAGTTSIALPLPTLERLGDARVCLAHSLPAPVSQLIDDVVRRTRLWRRERIDVARELIAHFEDGVQADRASEELVATFGEPRAVARLIRRAKLRQRPWAWRASRRMLQATGVFMAFVVVCWIWLLIRFVTAEPTVKRDFVGEWDQRTQAVAENDRAWPFYRTAFMKFHKAKLPDNSPQTQMDWGVLAKSLEAGAGSEHWSFWREHLESNQQALALTLQGTEKRQLGFVYRDVSNQEWLESQGPKGFDPQGFSRHQECARGLLVGVLLPHIQEMRELQLLLAVEAEEARSKHDRARWLRAWSANLSLAEQLPSDCAVIQLTGFFYASQSWSWLRNVLAKDPTLLTDDDLRQVAHRIAAFQGGGRLRLRVDREFGEDLLQRFYTDDGDGDGRLTQDYFRMLGDAERRLFGKTDPSRDPRRLDTILEWSAHSGVIASRAEMQQALQQYFDLEASESAKPLWEQALDEPSPGQRLLHEWYRSKWQRLRLQPFLGIMQPLISMEETPNPQRSWQAAEFATLNRDATLVAIALTVYHHRHGEWPERLEQLCPDLLPQVPLDRFDGQPLRYRVVDGKPLVYSVARNRLDDQGQVTDDKRNGPEAREGDWRLWPSM